MINLVKQNCSIGGNKTPTTSPSVLVSSTRLSTTHRGAFNFLNQNASNTRYTPQGEEQVSKGVYLAHLSGHAIMSISRKSALDGGVDGTRTRDLLRDRQWEIVAYKANKRLISVRQGAFLGEEGVFWSSRGGGRGGLGSTSATNFKQLGTFRKEGCLRTEGNLGRQYVNRGLIHYEISPRLFFGSRGEWMRWFKHFTDAGRDEELCKIVEEMGDVAYAKWWRLVEAVADQMDKNGKPELSYTAKEWARVLRTGNATLATRYLTRYEEGGLVGVAHLPGDVWQTSIPKLLELQGRDFKRARHERGIEVEEEVDVEVEEDKTPISPISSLPKQPKKNPEGFDEFWKAHPRKVAKPNALKAWIRLNPTPELRSKIIAAVEAAKKSEDWSKDGGRFIPHPATYLNQRRWEDQGPEVLTWQEKFLAEVK